MKRKHFQITIATSDSPDHIRVKFAWNSAKAYVREWLRDRCRDYPRGEWVRINHWANKSDKWNFVEGREDWQYNLTDGTPFARVGAEIKRII